MTKSLDLEAIYSLYNVIQYVKYYIFHFTENARHITGLCS